MDASAAAPVLRLASRVADPRRHNRLHPLPEMIVMALIAILCGSDGWDDVADFCEARDDWFGQLLTLPRGIPSHDTFSRVFARLDPLELEAMLQQWMAALCVASGGKLIAIDGKSIRRSFQHAWDTSGMAHVVSAFASENQLVLANLGVLNKENEIVAIPKLLAMLGDLTGSTVTIDAIGCQRNIAQQIVDAKGHYVLQVKENQPTLHTKVKGLLDDAILDRMKGWAGASTFKDVDAGHGRIEQRRAWLTTEVEHLGSDLLALWPSVRAIAAVERVRELMGKEKKVPTTERHYFILSDPRCTAERAGQIIRGHWAIENGLHHVLDVSYSEDQSRVRKGHGAENLSRLRRLTANLLRRNGSKRSIRGQRKRCGWSDEYLFNTLFRGLTDAQAG
jgi:predicted transposase YbfD/YdcC